MSDAAPRPAEASGASRRTFLSGAGLTGLAVAGTGLMSAAEAQAATVVPTRYALEFDGVTKGGVPTKAVGGELYGDVITSGTGGSIRNKYVANLEYSDVSMTCGAGMSQKFYDGLTKFTSGLGGLHDGKITRRDDANRVFHTLEFFDAPITALSFPAVEKGSTGTAQMSLTLQPNRAQLGGTAGAAQTAPARAPWRTGGFVFGIYALAGDNPRPKIDTSKVVRVNAITLKQTVTPSPAPGGGGSPTFGPLEVSDLVFAVADNNPTSLYDWYRDFIIEGNRVNTERAAVLYYADTANKALFRLSLTNVGIYRIEPATALVGTEKVVRTNVYAYCESAVFSVLPGAAL